MKNVLIKYLNLLIYCWLLQHSLIAQPPDHAKIAKAQYGNDAAWYLQNIPFFECSDKQIENVYYYRWKLYKAHIRNTGPNAFVITEFINHVPWDREPFCTINAASMHHIYEGRWLADPHYMDGYLSNLCLQGGNNRRYSESVADAAYARYLVNGDKRFLVSLLDSMKYSFNLWSDHIDSSKDLYYIPAMPDATEYNIAAIDASGGKDGFEGGEAFRPTINSYMYANALAIARTAALKGDDAMAKDFFEKADLLKKNIQQNLWNPSLEHFTDRYKVNNQHVHYWDFIRGRELAGFAPWYFNLPDDDPKYHKAWKHLTDAGHLLGQYGYRTNEPSYQYYFHQFLYHEGKRGSQWNGPSWPYQSSQALTGMANFLQHYKQSTISNKDYVHALRLFAQQHYLPDGKINLVENYDPNLGGPIVHFYWSNHYLHSSFNNLVITGLCGIQPSADETITILPLADESIDYFCLTNLRYHGHKITIVYDRTGSKYKLGKGLTAFVDGKKTKLVDQKSLYTGPALLKRSQKETINYSLNITRDSFPKITASVNASADSLFPLTDGRIWYFKEITNRWVSYGAKKTAWIEMDLGNAKAVSSLKFYPVSEEGNFALPEKLTVQYFHKGKWISLKSVTEFKTDTRNSLHFLKTRASKFRLLFEKGEKPVAFSEIEIY
ncbi:MAG: trehalase family glycosidase [Ferruginibacter sp.]